MTAVRWSVGVTTVPARRKDPLPRTLRSLAHAGFEVCRLFVDGDADGASWEREFGLPVTARWPACGPEVVPGHVLGGEGKEPRRIGTWPSYLLALWELWLRDAKADRYVIFQDDCVACRNARQLLDAYPFPEKGYWNLYTFSNTNEPVVRGKPAGWHEGGPLDPKGERVGCWQAGRGAVGLVFSREGLRVLLTHRDTFERPLHVDKPWWRKIDGWAVNTLNKEGWTEWIHNPSLLQHTGDRSATGNMPHKLAQTFPGEMFDALELLKK